VIQLFSSKKKQTGNHKLLLKMDVFTQFNIHRYETKDDGFYSNNQINKMKTKNDILLVGSDLME
jgi:hypothetical protein